MSCGSWCVIIGLEFAERQPEAPLPCHGHSLPHLWCVVDVCRDGSNLSRPAVNFKRTYALEHNFVLAWGKAGLAIANVKCDTANTPDDSTPETLQALGCRTQRCGKAPAMSCVGARWNWEPLICSTRMAN